MRLPVHTVPSTLFLIWKQPEKEQKHQKKVELSRVQGGAGPLSMGRLWGVWQQGSVHGVLRCHCSCCGCVHLGSLPVTATLCFSVACMPAKRSRCQTMGHRTLRTVATVAHCCALQLLFRHYRMRKSNALECL